MKIKNSTNFLKRLVFSYTIVFSILMAILIIIATYYMISYRNEERALNNMILIDQPLKELERVLSNADDTAYRVMGDVDILNQFTYLQSNAEEGNYFEKNVLDAIDTGSVLANIDSKNNASWRIVIYNDREDYIYHGALVDKVEAEEFLSSYAAKATMDYFKKYKTEFYLMPPQEDKWSNYFNSKYFTIVRPIKNLYQDNTNVGIVEVQNSIQIIIDAVTFDPSTKLYVNIYDDKGNPVYLQNTSNEFSCEVVSEKYNWTVQLVEDKSIGRNDAISIIVIMFLLWLSIVLTMYFITKPIITNITRPLTKLSDNLSQLNPTLPEEIPHIDTEIDEIVALEKAFNNVLKERTISMEFEKSAYFMALQSQIDPHFIHNVLSVINTAAIEENYDLVMNISVNLSKMLRYSSAFDSKISSLKEELEYTETYLNLMKARYYDLFEYSVEIDGDLLDIIVPKLIIQPICENSFMHGFGEKEPPYKIEVKIKKFGDSVSMKVIDNGQGFSDEKRLDLLNKLNSEIDIDFTDKKFGGLGLGATVERLKLFTKKQVECKIYKIENDTVVEVIFKNTFL